MDIGLKKPSIPEGLWIKCLSCNDTIYRDDYDEKFNICPNCNKHHRIDVTRRLEITVDKGSFKEYDTDLTTVNKLNFPKYIDKIELLEEKTGLKEAVVTGECKINKNKAVIAIMDSRFLMGSMGSVVGEKITRAIEKATAKKLPIIIFTASGGARMQEGIFSLMQMAKTSAALKRHSKAGQLYISVLTDPTTGGVTASFAMLGDIILAEPKALIGFAGRRVIEQTINQQLPEGFQTSEFLLEHGFIDKVVNRRELKDVLSSIIAIHKGGRR